MIRTTDSSIPSIPYMMTFAREQNGWWMRIPCAAIAILSLLFVSKWRMIDTRHGDLIYIYVCGFRLRWIAIITNTRQSPEEVVAGVNCHYGEQDANGRKPRGRKAETNNNTTWNELNNINNINLSSTQGKRHVIYSTAIFNFWPSRHTSSCDSSRLPPLIIIIIIICNAIK